MDTAISKRESNPMWKGQLSNLIQRVWQVHNSTCPPSI